MILYSLFILQHLVRSALPFVTPLMILERVPILRLKLVCVINFGTARLSLIKK
jgi:hypothetical protein